MRKLEVDCLSPLKISPRTKFLVRRHHRASHLLSTLCRVGFDSLLLESQRLPMLLEALSFCCCQKTTASWFTYISKQNNNHGSSYSALSHHDQTSPSIPSHTLSVLSPSTAAMSRSSATSRDCCCGKRSKKQRPTLPSCSNHNPTIMQKSNLHARWTPTFSPSSRSSGTCPKPIHPNFYK
jgi:hypothetical protein